MKTLSPENDLLKIQFLPDFGGKIVSLRSVRTGEEFVLPSRNEYAHVRPSEENADRVLEYGGHRIAVQLSSSR